MSSESIAENRTNIAWIKEKINRLEQNQKNQTRILVTSLIGVITILIEMIFL